MLNPCALNLYLIKFIRGKIVLNVSVLFMRVHLDVILVSYLPLLSLGYHH